MQDGADYSLVFVMLSLLSYLLCVTDVLAKELDVNEFGPNIDFREYSFLNNTLVSSSKVACMRTPCFHAWHSSNQWLSCCAFQGQVSSNCPVDYACPQPIPVL
jgi:uncharacterized protein CbrC (UPF0167 family)